MGGKWYWYEKKPIARNDKFYDSGGEMEAVEFSNWEESLEERP